MYKTTHVSLENLKPYIKNSQTKETSNNTHSISELECYQLDKNMLKLVQIMSI